MIKALTIPLAQDIRPLSRLLWSRNIQHRISEHAGQQVVWVANDKHLVLVKELYQQYQAGDLEDYAAQPIRDSSRADFRLFFERVWRYLLASPIISLLILISVLVTLLLYGAEQSVFLLLRMGSPAYILESGEYWRLITPIFLHFNVMHLAFNLLMLWVFGHQIEMRGETARLVLLILVSAAASNIAQYYDSGSGFGGMSGVVFAILAFCWMWDRLNPQNSYNFPAALMGLMMFWLVLGFTDVLRLVGFGPVANTAHLVGLLIGLILAWVFTWLRRSP